MVFAESIDNVVHGFCHLIILGNGLLIGLILVVLENVLHTFFIPSRWIFTHGLFFR